MPRGPRLDYPGALHHVMARGIERRRIFRCDGDRTDLLRRVGEVVRTSGTQIYAWCLMPNHAHFLLRTADVGLSALAQAILGGYASAFNRRHRRCGHFFQNRFRSILVEEQPYMLELIRYIHLNPLRAGLCADLAALDRYRWSGHPVLLGCRRCTWQACAPVLQQFGGTVGQARRAYRRFLLDGLQRGSPSDLEGGGLRRSAGGWRAVAELRCGRERWAHDERILGTGTFVDTARELAAKEAVSGLRAVDSPAAIRRLLERVAKGHRVPVPLIASGSKRREVVRARYEFCQRAVKEHGWSIRAVAAYLGVAHTSVQRALRSATKSA